MELAITGPAAEHQSTGSSQHRTPVRALCVVVRPYTLAGVNVPGLHFSEMVGARDGERLASSNSDERPAGRVLNLRAHVGATDVVIGRDINHPRLRTERDGWPVLSAVRSRTKVGAFAGAGFVSGVHVRTSGLGIQTPEHILIDVGFAFDELDRPRASLEEPQITIARDINQAFDGAPVALIVHEDGRRDFVVIPRVVLVVLEVALDRAGRYVERDRRCGVEVVAWTIVADRRSSVAGSKERQVGFRIIIASDPHGSASRFPLIAIRPRFAAALSGRRNGISPPQLLAGIEVEGRNEAADSELSSRRTHHDFAAGHQRSQRDVIAGFVIRDRSGPDFLSGSCIESNEDGFAGRVINLVAIERNATIRLVRHGSSGRPRSPVSPEYIAAPGVDGDDLIVRRGHEHRSVIHNRSSLVNSRLGGRKHPYWPQPRDIRWCDLVQRAITPAVIRAPDHQPVLGFGILETL